MKLSGPEWIDQLQVGDVIRNRGGFRVVRKVSRLKDPSRGGMRKYNERAGQVNCVTLSILRCSWTKRPYTIVNRYDLSYAGYTPANFRIRLDKPLDIQLAHELESQGKTMTCCDVIGVLR